MIADDFGNLGTRLIVSSGAGTSVLPFSPKFLVENSLHKVISGPALPLARLTIQSRAKAQGPAT